MAASTVPCFHPHAHGVRTHKVGSQAAIDCASTYGGSGASVRIATGPGSITSASVSRDPYDGMTIEEAYQMVGQDQLANGLDEEYPQTNEGAVEYARESLHMPDEPGSGSWEFEDQGDRLSTAYRMVLENRDMKPDAVTKVINKGSSEDVPPSKAWDDDDEGYEPSGFSKGVLDVDYGALANSVREGDQNLIARLTRAASDDPRPSDKINNVSGSDLRKLPGYQVVGEPILVGDTITFMKDGKSTVEAVRGQGVTGLVNYGNDQDDADEYIDAMLEAHWPEWNTEEHGSDE